MLATVLSGAFVGVDAYIVKVEVDISDGQSAFSKVGLTDSCTLLEVQAVTLTGDVEIRTKPQYFMTLISDRQAG